MKKSHFLLSLFALLFASSGILSQTSNEAVSATENNNNKLILAKINPVQTGPVKNNPHAAESITKPDIREHKLIEKQVKYFSDEELALQRQLFLKAENALKMRDDAEYFLLADQLKNYPLYPYLQYQWLRKNLRLERQITHFLKQHSTSRFSIKLKTKWLHHLGKKKKWPQFLENYTATKNNTLNCYLHRAQMQTGNTTAALAGAKKLWSVGHSQPSACDPLFSQLKKSELFTQELRWQRFDAALQNNKYGLASYIKNLMPREYHATAQLWLNLHRKSSKHIQKLLKQPITAQSSLMFRHAIDRLAREDINKAIEIWDANKKRFNIDKSLAKDKLERRLAFKLVFEHESGAYERLSQLNKQDKGSRTWRVRVALSQQNWPKVLTAIHALESSEKVKEKWQYWLARAYMETGKIAMAQGLLTELSDKRSFYGFLAADKVNGRYKLSDNPVNVTAEEITTLKNRQEYRVAFEFMVLDRKNEAKLQWWHALKELNKKEIITAAKLAQQWQWDEIAIFTIAKAKHWDDIEMRFPISYAENVHKNSVRHNINPAILFGLIRRESAFNVDAYSPVGARGLMQIMPGTGRTIARHFNERWYGSKGLHNPARNIKYGSYYYQKLLNQFDGHYAIALAAYNAGPARVKKWLPEEKSMPADIWIETIPYKETREYVASVLAYTLIYQQRTNTDSNSELTMNDFTIDIPPLAVKR